MGFPSPADDYKEASLLLDDLIVHPAATYFIKMTGVAMEPTIHHGDILVVDRILFRWTIKSIPLQGRLLSAQVLSQIGMQLANLLLVENIK